MEINSESSSIKVDSYNWNNSNKQFVITSLPLDANYGAVETMHWLVLQMDGEDIGGCSKDE